jgi:hypothetical protein
MFVVACLLLRWLFEAMGVPSNFAAAAAGIGVSIATAAVVFALVRRRRHESSDHALADRAAPPSK